MRKFEIISVELIPGGSGPERSFKVKYRAIVNKVWIEKELWSIGRNEEDARKRAEKRLGGKK